MPRLLADLTPLRTIPAYRRVWSALSISNIGQQMAAVAVGFQVYELTKSSFMVGLVGLFQLVPMIGFGLYGGALSDAHDRRIVATISAVGLWVASVALAVQAVLGLGSVAVLYAIIAVQSGFYAVGSATRQAITPRIVPTHLLPAANALSSMTWSLGFSLGPLLGGLIIGVSGSVTAAYLVDAVAFAVMIWAMLRLPSLPPLRDPNQPKPKTGWASVADGLRFLRGRRNLTMTFYVDLAAMVLASPRALLPAIASQWFGGSTAQVAMILGVLSGAPAIGALLSSIFSGPLGAIRYQGRVIVVAIILWGVAISAFGLTRWLPLAVFLLALAGAADNVSAVFRTTILQAATPDEYRGRLQGVFTVVVAGGPKLGDVQAGTVASIVGESTAVVAGGMACIAVVLGLTRWRRQFWDYDAHHPVA